MLLIPSIKMKSLEGSRQVRYNKTTSLLVAVHTWRILGIFFLWGVSLGILHPAFGIPAGVGDILVGVTAIPFAYFLWKGFSWSKYALVVWSVLGIADLVNAVSLGLITASEFGVSTMTFLPWVLVPYCRRTSCTCAAWNYTLPSKEYIIYFRE